MGCYLSTPNGDQHLESGAEAGLSFGVCNLQGWRRNQEDAHIASPAFDSDVSLFAVFDGHGGAEVALYCERNFGRALRSTNAYASGDYAVALRDAFLKVDEMLRTQEGFEEVCRLKRKHDAEQANINSAHAARQDEGKDSGSPSHQQLGTVDVASLLRGSGLGSDVDGHTDSDGDDKGDEIIQIGNGIQMSRREFQKILNAQIKATREAQIRAQVDAVRDALADDGYGDDDDDDKCGSSGDSSSSSSSSSSCDNVASVPITGAAAATMSSSSPQERREEPQDNDIEANEFEYLIGDEDEDDDERPSFASGCTAVVALLDRKANVVYVANAGDSRCVLARGGKAVDLSEDHKPEDRVEITRIEKAGGYVTDEGRVNGCLNLSRAIGDLRYKANINLRPDEQIISCHPDVVRCQLYPSGHDKFLVLMCDGITGSLTNQEVVDRVMAGASKSTSGGAGGGSGSGNSTQSTSAEGETYVHATLAQICGNVCDECMSHDIDSNDGAGCDNETFMIVRLSGEGASASSSSEPSPNTFAPRTVDLPPLPKMAGRLMSGKKRPAPGSDLGTDADSYGKRRKAS